MKKKKCREKVQRFREKPGNREKELEQKRKSYPGAQATKKKKYYDTRKKDSTLNDLKYRKSIQFGPLFICVCCHAGLFKRNVKVFTKKLLNNIDPEILDSSCIFSEEFMDPLEKENFYVCHSCYTTMKKNQMPKRSVHNGLYVDVIPPELQLTPLESQCIARHIIFLKIQELPKTRMKKMIDRSVLVPIEDNTVLNTVEQLPRSLDSSAFVGVQLKRMREMKNVHVKGFIRPTKLFEALVCLKVLGNPHYQTIITKCLYCPREFKEGDVDMLDHVRECLVMAQSIDHENRDEGIEREQFKTKLRPSMKADMSKVKAKLDQMTQEFNSELQKNGADVILEPCLDMDVAIEEDKEEEFRIFQYHFESLKEGKCSKSSKEEDKLFEEDDIARI